MPGALKAGLVCPVCGRSVLAVFHDWRFTADLALFEYHHHADVQATEAGGDPSPCVLRSTYAEGQARFEAESGPPSEGL